MSDESPKPADATASPTAPFRAAGGVEGTLALTESSPATVPRLIAGYRLIEILGEGGMGTVYLAEQQQPVRRIVALKVTRTTLAGRAVDSRQWAVGSGQ